MIAMVNTTKQVKKKIFRLPRDPAERERWIKMIPRDNIPDNPNTVIRERHFPSGYETITVFGRKRPRHPPSIFDCVKPSLIPSTPASPRPTSKACSTKTYFKSMFHQDLLQKHVPPRPTSKACSTKTYFKSMFHQDLLQKHVPPMTYFKSMFHQDLLQKHVPPRPTSKSMFHQDLLQKHVPPRPTSKACSTKTYFKSMFHQQKYN